MGALIVKVERESEVVRREKCEGACEAVRREKCEGALANHNSKATKQEWGFLCSKSVRKKRSTTERGRRPPTEVVRKKNCSAAEGPAMEEWLGS